MNNIAYIGIGSNLNNPYIQTILALKHISNHTNILLKYWSNNYISTPLSIDTKHKKNNYQNLVLKIKTSLSASDLLFSLHDIEKKIGRNRSKEKARWESRIIDLDILIFSQNNKILEIKTKDLTIPHMEIHKRNFVVYPLEEINSNLQINNTPIKNIKNTLGTEGLSIYKKIPANVLD